MLSPSEWWILVTLCNTNKDLNCPCHQVLSTSNLGIGGKTLQLLQWYTVPHSPTAVTHSPTQWYRIHSDTVVHSATQSHTIHSDTAVVPTALNSKQILGRPLLAC